MLINCARGGIVNEDDLHDALASNHLGGAALDVFETEPPGKICLMDLDNFICTSHLGASTHEAQDNVARDVANQMVDCGIRAIWNFTPVRLQVPENVVTENAAITASLGVLSNRLGQLLHGDSQADSSLADNPLPDDDS